MNEGVFSGDLWQGCTLLSFMQMTHIYTSLSNTFLSEVILVKAPSGIQVSESDSAWKTLDKRQPEHNRSMDQYEGANYKHWGNSWLIAPKHNYQPAQKKLMYGCSGATASKALMHLSLKTY